MFQLTKTLSASVATFAFLMSGQISLAQLPSVSGNVVHEGSALSGVELTLYADDGDMAFDIDLDSGVATVSSGAGGKYSFSSLDASTNYFVYQGPQSVGSLSLLGAVSGLLDPLVETLLVDGFEQQQRIEANPLSMVGSENLSGGSILGGQRDLHVEYSSGPAETVLHANPWGLSNVLQFDQSAGSVGVATITWDGEDTDTSTTPATDGLGGLDLTTDGGEAFAFRAGVDEAGAGDTITLRVFSGDDISTAYANLPVTNGTALLELLVPFSTFTGAADFTSVDAIQAVIGGSQSSIDAQIGPLHVVSGATADIMVTTPEPAASLAATLASLAVIFRRKRRR